MEYKAELGETIYTIVLDSSSYKHLMGHKFGRSFSGLAFNLHNKTPAERIPAFNVSWYDTTS